MVLRILKRRCPTANYRCSSCATAHREVGLRRFRGGIARGHKVENIGERPRRRWTFLHCRRNTLLPREDVQPLLSNPGFLSPLTPSGGFQRPGILRVLPPLGEAALLVGLLRHTDCQAGRRIDSFCIKRGLSIEGSVLVVRKLLDSIILNQVSWKRQEGSRSSCGMLKSCARPPTR